MSDSPRTDATDLATPIDFDPVIRDARMASLARQLERELAAMTADRDHFFKLSGKYLDELSARSASAETGCKAFGYFDTNEKKLYPTKGAAELMGCIESELIPLYRWPPFARTESAAPNEDPDTGALRPDLEVVVDRVYGRLFSELNKNGILLPGCDTTDKALAVIEKFCAETLARAEGAPSEAEHLRMQIGYIATELMVRGDPRSLPEIVETAAEATKGGAGPADSHK